MWSCIKHACLIRLTTILCVTNMTTIAGHVVMMQSHDVLLPQDTIQPQSFGYVHHVFTGTAGNAKWLING